MPDHLQVVERLATVGQQRCDGLASIDDAPTTKTNNDVTVLVSSCSDASIHNVNGRFSVDPEARNVQLGRDRHGTRRTTQIAQVERELKGGNVQFTPLYLFDDDASTPDRPVWTKTGELTRKRR